MFLFCFFFWSYFSESDDTEADDDGLKSLDGLSNGNHGGGKKKKEFMKKVSALIDFRYGMCLIVYFRLVWYCFFF